MKKDTVTINCLLFQLGLARKKVQRKYEEYLASVGLNPSYIYVMEVVNDCGPCSLTAIAEYLELERPTVSHLLARMERDGFIQRLPGDERRSMKVHVTDKGKQILEEALQGLRQADKSLDSELGGNLDSVKEAILLINANL